MKFVVFIIYLFIYYYLFIIYLFRVIPHSERIRISRFRKFAASTEESKFVPRTLHCTELSELFDKSNRSFLTFSWPCIVINSYNKTLHVSDSSSVHRQDFFTVHTAMVYVIQLASRIRTEPVSSWSCLQAVSKPVWQIPLPCVQWNTPDDGQRSCPKHVEFYSKKINLRN